MPEQHRSEGETREDRELAHEYLRLIAHDLEATVSFEGPPHQRTDLAEVVGKEHSDLGRHVAGASWLSATFHLYRERSRENQRDE